MKYKKLPLIYFLSSTEDWSNLYLNQNSKLGYTNIKSPSNIFSKNNINQNQYVYLCSERNINKDEWAKSPTGNIHLADEKCKENKCLKIEFTNDTKLISNGIPTIDGDTKAIVEWMDFPKGGEKDVEVNFLTEFVRRYNLNKKDEQVLKRLEEVWGDDKDGGYDELYKHHKSIQKGIDVDNLINKYTDRILVDYPEKDKIHIDLMGFLNETTQSNAEGFSFDDLNRVRLWCAGLYGNEFKTLDELAQSFTKESSKDEIVIECEMENRCCGRCNGDDDICVTDMICEKHKIEGCEICYGERGDRIKLKDGQPILTFK